MDDPNRSHSTATVVLDTNVFVAAAFSPASSSGRIVDAVRRGTLRMAWADETRRETVEVLRRIPPVREEEFIDLFRPRGRFDGALEPDQFEHVPDPGDRKFAALAFATEATLVTNDAGLLGAKGSPLPVTVTPKEFAATAI